MNIDNDDVRWKQRFQNFCRAFDHIHSALEDKNIDGFSELEQEGIIQRFEYTFELGWRTFKDYLEFSGVKLTEVTPQIIYKFDVVAYKLLKNTSLQQHIDRVGVVIYERCLI
ncbi:MAG: nucleotidyltransferase substrate binding protein [Deferribacteraceae bacterium]|jgi:hypothetical protein|nr:nucleotidyltransferase substrate binding protein [Deferribacteraceae bacterium]